MSSHLDPDLDSQPRRRRFGRRASDLAVETSGHADQLAALTAEVVLLREENARLKAAQHAAPDLGNVLGRARRLPTSNADHEGAADEAAQLLVEGLVIRESLLEVCHEIERSMVALEARLNALAPTPEDASELTRGLPAADQIRARKVQGGSADTHEEERNGPGFA
jgi:hypothetical protein